jgi:hypothetical protein
MLPLSAKTNAKREHYHSSRQNTSPPNATPSFRWMCRHLVATEGADGMDTTIEVSIPVDPDAASMLADPQKRAEMGQLISTVLRESAEPDPLIRAIRAVQADVRASGITEAEIDAELAAWKAERQMRT